MFLVNEIIALLGTNLILTQALGTSTLFIAAENRGNLVRTACIITIFTTAGSSAVYLINRYTRLEDTRFDLLSYVLAVGVLYILLLTLSYFINRKSFEKTKKYIHISAFNCAVLGTLFTITESEKISGEKFAFSDYIFRGLEAGIGFIIAAFILTAAYDRLNSSKVPSSFRGFPAMLVYLGIISMAVYSLT